MKNKENVLSQHYEINGGDFSNAGNISTQIKETLKELGIRSSLIRRAAIAAYEAEMNVVMYAHQGQFQFSLTPSTIHFTVKDLGIGIEDIELAMQEGYSTATEELREMGFGAGMGLPNIKRNSDQFQISSTPGKGTFLDIFFYLNQREK
ncbi:anti-sigma regulatory factor [bacterium]|nr:anti-sigma regulatory factor [bacterium]